MRNLALLLTALAVMLVSPAVAGKLTLTLRIDANNVFKGDSVTPDASVRRILDAYKGIYFPGGATDQEVALKISNEVFDMLRFRARQYERDSAAKTVTDLPADPAIP